MHNSGDNPSINQCWTRLLLALLRNDIVHGRSKLVDGLFGVFGTEDRGSRNEDV